jgi:hypothetical protein
MKSNFSKTAIRQIILIVIMGLVLTVLAGCGIGNGLNRYGFNGYRGTGSGDDYRNSGSYGTMYGPDVRGYYRHTPGYRDSRGEYCGW